MHQAEPRRVRSLYSYAIASEGKEPDGSTVLCSACFALRAVTGDTSHTLGPLARVRLDLNLGREEDDPCSCEDCGAERYDEFTDAELCAMRKHRESRAWNKARERPEFER